MPRSFLVKKTKFGGYVVPRDITHQASTPRTPKEHQTGYLPLTGGS